MTTLQVKNIIPEPLVKEGQVPKSDIWGKDLSFTKGNFYLVEAPSGKGKSTFLHILYGLRKDYEGTLLIDDKLAADQSSEDWLQLRRDQLSLVFQDLRLFPQLTAWENIQLKNNLKERIKKEELQDWCKSLGLNVDLLKQKAHSLSYGQRQRVAIIRALCQPFSLLLLDEPFSHLDDQNMERAANLLMTVCKRQEAGMILVSLGPNTPFAFTESYIL